MVFKPLAGTQQTGEGEGGKKKKKKASQEARSQKLGVQCTHTTHTHIVPTPRESQRYSSGQGRSLNRNLAVLASSLLLLPAQEQAAPGAARRGDPG